MCHFSLDLTTDVYTDPRLLGMAGPTASYFLIASNFPRLLVRGLVTPVSHCDTLLLDTLSRSRASRLLARGAHLPRSHMAPFAERSSLALVPEIARAQPFHRHEPYVGVKCT